MPTVMSLVGRKEPRGCLGTCSVEYYVYFTPWYKCPLSSALWVLKCYLLLSHSASLETCSVHQDAFQAYDSLFWPEG